MSAIGLRAKKIKSKKQDARIAIMIDKAAACLDITATKNHQIIASQSISIPVANPIDDKTASAVATAVDAFCQQHQLKNPAYAYVTRQWLSNAVS